MRKIYSSLLFAILIIGIVTAGIVTNIAKDIQITKERKTVLEDNNIISYNFTDSLINTGETRRCLFYVDNKNGTRDIACEEFINPSMEELNVWEKNTINNYADMLIRQKRTEIKIREGITAIKEER